MFDSRFRGNHFTTMREESCEQNLLSSDPVDVLRTNCGNNEVMRETSEVDMGGKSVECI